MVQRSAISQQVPNRPCCTGLLIECSVDEACNPRPDDGTGTHRTGLEGHDKGGTVEPPPAGRLGGTAQRHELGMPERILIDFTSIVSAPDHRTSAVEDHRSDGNVVMLAGQARLGEGEFHPILKLQVGTEAEFRALLRCAQRAA